MTKIYNSIIDKMIEAKLNANEISFMLCISRFQENSGLVSGVHYKEVCDKMDMSHQGYYNCKKSLQEKGFINVEKRNKIDCDITILNNAFYSEEDFKKGYLKTSLHIFQEKRFYKMKAGAQLLAIFLLRQFSCSEKNDQKFFRKNTKDFFKEYTDKFKVSIRVLRSYLMELKEFFSIGVKEKSYFIRPKAGVFKNIHDKTAEDLFKEHKVDMICRREYVKEDPKGKHMKDMYTLVRQYKGESDRMGLDVFIVLQSALKETMTIFNKLKDRVIMPKLVHKYMRQILEY